MRTAAILTAAGSGSRLGHTLPKALVPLDGLSLVAHAARRLAGSGVVDLLVVTAPAAHLEDVRAAVGDEVDAAGGPAAGDDAGVPTHAGRGPVPAVCTVGGPSRQASVAAALAVLPPDVDVVLVHDAARALAPGSLVRRVVDAVRAGHPAVVPATAVMDTIAEVASAPTGAPGDLRTVIGTPDRSVLRAVQTPQGFDRAVLDRAHAAAAHRAGDERAVKITSPRDLALAHLLLAEADRADAVPAHGEVAR